MRFKVERSPRGSRTEQLHLIHPDEGSIGSLQYVRHPDRLQIELLRVKREHRGNGYASQLMDELQRRNPAIPIDHGERTDAGHDWWDAYSFGKDVQNGRTMASRKAATIRMVPPEEYQGFHYPDYPQAKSPAALVRHFKKTSPEYYDKVKSDVQQNGFTTPVLVRYHGPGGRPLKRPQVMEGHHRAAVAHELGMHLPVGDYDSPEDYDIASRGGQEWFQNNQRPTGDMPKQAAAGWQFEHHPIEGQHWRSFGGPPEQPRRVFVDYKKHPEGLEFDHGSMAEYMVRRHGPDAVAAVQQAAQEHHGLGEHIPAPPPPPKPQRRVYYHGTTVPNVTHILPADRHSNGVMFPHDTSRAHAYASLDKSSAWDYATKAHAITGDKPRVYQVRPMGGDHSHVEDDPTWDERTNRLRGNNEGDRRSRVGWEVVRELKTPREIHENYDWPGKDEGDDE